MKIGKIYKIIHNQSNICYVGSTFNTLRDRWKGHKNSFSKYLNTNSPNVSIFSCFKQYGMENFKIVLIKEYEVIDRKHLEMYEQLWINKLKSINKNNSFQIEKLYYKSQGKKYYENNKEKILIYHQQYYKDNKEKIQEYKKSYKENNIEKFKQKCNCKCGGKYSYSHKSTHLKTKKHQNYVNNNILL